MPRSRSGLSFSESVGMWLVFDGDVDLSWPVGEWDVNVGSLCVSVKADGDSGVIAELGKFFLQVVQKLLGGERAGYLHVRVFG